MLKVENVRFVEKGFLRAFFDVNIPEWHLTIFGCQYFLKGTSKWVSMPSRKVDVEGEKPKFFPYIKFDKAVQDKFNEACLEALKVVELQPAPAKQPEPRERELDIF